MFHLRLHGSKGHENGPRVYVCTGLVEKGGACALVGGGFSQARLGAVFVDEGFADDCAEPCAKRSRNGSAGY